MFLAGCKGRKSRPRFKYCSSAVNLEPNRNPTAGVPQRNEGNPYFRELNATASHFTLSTISEGERYDGTGYSADKFWIIIQREIVCYPQFRGNTGYAADNFWFRGNTGYAADNFWIIFKEKVFATHVNSEGIVWVNRPSDMAHI